MERAIMKKPLLQLFLILSGIVFASNLVFAEFLTKKPNRNSPSDKWNQNWEQTEKRKVKGQLGRGSKYTSNIPTHPLEMWWNQSAPHFDTQY